MDRERARWFAAVTSAATNGILPSGGNTHVAGEPGRPEPRDIVYRQWSLDADLAGGVLDGVVVGANALTIGQPVGRRTYTDPYNATTGTYDYATWTSPQVPLDFAATEVIASWTASTPGASWIQVELRGVTERGNTTAWYVMDRWAADDAAISRTSVSAQSDADGHMVIDTFVAAQGRGLVRWQLRVTLLRPAGTTITPQVRSIGAVTSRLPAPRPIPASTPKAAQGVVLDVPRYSQDVHSGQHPQWDGGGEAWCSPTSTSMVVAYWGTGPTPADYEWVEPGHADPWVDFAARNTYDYNYQGTGNWPFNTAYASRFGLDGFITRLRSLNEAELFIAAGVPLICSISFKKDEIPGLSYGTSGHLLVLVGFSANGAPVVNDPAAPTDTGVRKTVGRAEFEAAWLNTSRGIVYVIHPESVALPERPAQPNW